MSDVRKRVEIWGDTRREMDGPSGENAMNIEAMNLNDLLQLRDAIRREATRRLRELRSLAPRQGRRYVNRANGGRKTVFVPEQFEEAARAGMTVTQAARHIGCHPSRVYQVAAQLGLAFARGKAGRPSKS